MRLQDGQFTLEVPVGPETSEPRGGTGPGGQSAQSTELFLVPPAAPTWPEPALHPGQQEPLLGKPLSACGQCSSGDTDTHTLVEGWLLDGGGSGRFHRKWYLS